MDLRYLLPVLLTSVLLSNLVQAQDDRSKVKTSISDAANVTDDLYPVRTIKTADNSLVVFYASAAGDFVDLVPQEAFTYRFDMYTMDKLELQRSVEPVLKGPVALEDIVYFGGSPILIASQRRGAENKFKVYWQKFDPRLTRNNAPALELATIDHVKASRGAALEGKAAAPFGLKASLSPDKSKLLIQGSMNTIEKKPIHFVMVVNDKMEVLLHELISGDEKVEGSELLSAVVDNSGVCTAWVRNRLIKGEVKEGALPYVSRIYRMSSEGVAESEFIMTGGATSIDAELMVVDSGAVFCAGVYGELEAKKEKTPGTFSAMMGKGEMQFSQTSRTKFPPMGKTGEQVPEHMSVANLSRGSDGKFYLICESSYSYSSQVMSTAGPNKQVTLDVRGDMAVGSFSPDGTSDWTTSVPRMVNSTSFMLGDPLAVVYEKQLNLLFLDAGSNNDVRQRGDRVETPVDVKDTRSLMLTFDGKGGYTTKTILASGKDVDFVAGSTVYQDSKDTYFINGQRKLGKGKFVPVKLEFSKDGK